MSGPRDRYAARDARELAREEESRRTFQLWLQRSVVARHVYAAIMDTSGDAETPGTWAHTLLAHFVKRDKADPEEWNIPAWWDEVAHGALRGDTGRFLRANSQRRPR